MFHTKVKGMKPSIHMQAKCLILHTPQPLGRGFMFFCLVFVMPLCAFVYLYLVVTSWERADLLALVCGV